MSNTTQAVRKDRWFILCMLKANHQWTKGHNYSSSIKISLHECFSEAKEHSADLSDLTPWQTQLSKFLLLVLKSCVPYSWWCVGASFCLKESIIKFLESFARLLTTHRQLEISLGGNIYTIKTGKSSVRSFYSFLRGWLLNIYRYFTAYRALDFWTFLFCD